VVRVDGGTETLNLGFRQRDRRGAGVPARRLICPAATILHSASAANSISRWTRNIFRAGIQTPSAIQRARFTAGGAANPLGARATYLSGTFYRIHGTNAPSIGSRATAGCIRMVNEDVIDLYDRVKGRHQGRGTARRRASIRSRVQRSR